MPTASPDVQASEQDGSYPVAVEDCQRLADSQHSTAEPSQNQQSDGSHQDIKNTFLIEPADSTQQEHNNQVIWSSHIGGIHVS